MRPRRTHEGPLLASCATCSHSRFVRADLHHCHLVDQLLEGEDRCENFEPMLVAPPQLLSLRPLPIVEIV